MVAVGARQETIMKLDADSTKAARTIGQAAGPWNRGKLIGQKLPLKLREVWSIRIRLQLRERLRDLAMFNLAVNSKLRGCDLVAMRVDDVVLSGRVRPRVSVMRKKTGRPVQFEITEQTRDAVLQWIKWGNRKPGDYLFPSRVGKDKPLGTRHYARLMDRWVSSIGLDPALYGTHSLRQTKVALIYWRTGNLRTAQLLLGHTKLDSTVRYLGIEVDDALAIAEQVDI
jgi:integrase